MDKQYLELSAADNSIAKDYETPPSKRMQGNSPDISTSKIRMYIGTKPILTDIKKLMKKHNKPVPPHIEIFKSYNAYFLPHTIGVIQEGGWDTIRQIGYQMKFPSDAEVIVLNVLPESKYVTTIKGDFNFEADLALNGEAGIPEKVKDLIEFTETVGVGGKLKVSSSSNLLGTFRFSVVSAEVMSIGKGNTYSEWVFNRGEAPLFGNDIEMFQLILVDKFYPHDKLKFQAKIYSVISTWNLLPSRRESEWIPIECAL
jgi:hypothetical protein